LETPNADSAPGIQGPVTGIWQPVTEKIKSPAFAGLSWNPVYYDELTLVMFI